MTTIKDTGGPAFPCDNILRRNEVGQFIGHEISSTGMTLRHHFAGLAMQGCMPALDYGGLDMFITDESLENLAKHWYRIADAMIKAGKT